MSEQQPKTFQEKLAQMLGHAESMEAMLDEVLKRAPASVKAQYVEAFADQKEEGAVTKQSKPASMHLV